MKVFFQDKVPVSDMERVKKPSGLNYDWILSYEEVWLGLIQMEQALIKEVVQDSPFCKILIFYGDKISYKFESKLIAEDKHEQKTWLRGTLL